MRQLVDKIAASRASVQGGPSEIILPHRLRLVWMNSGDKLRYRDRSAPRGHLHDTPQDCRRVGQFADRFDLGVTAQHLFQKRGSRAREADYEYWNALILAVGRQRPNEIAGDQPFEFGDFVRQLLRIIVNAVGALSVALAIMLERLCVTLSIVQRSRECKMQRRAVAFVDSDLEALLHRVDVGICKNTAFYAREAPPCFAALIIDLGSAPIGSDRVIDAARRSQIMAIGYPERCTGWIFLDEALQHSSRFVAAAHLVEGECVKPFELRVVTFPRQRIEQDAGFLQSFLLVQN